MTSDIKTTRGARAALREVSGVAGRLLTRKTMAKALVLFREVDIKGKVVDKNTREALTRWISCRVVTIAVAESHSILVRRLLTMINTGIRQRCDSDSSVPETTGLKGCLLNDIIKRLS